MAYGKCFLSGTEGIVERHHIFGGALRWKSEKYDLVVELSPWMHREGPQAAHRCYETRERLCKYGQKKAMLEQGWDLSRWREEFGKNWLEAYELEQVEALREDDGDRDNGAERSARPAEAGPSHGMDSPRAPRGDHVPGSDHGPKAPAIRFTVTAEILPF